MLAGFEEARGGCEQILSLCLDLKPREVQAIGECPGAVTEQLVVGLQTQAPVLGSRAPWATLTEHGDVENFGLLLAGADETAQELLILGDVVDPEQLPLSLALQDSLV